MRFERLWYGLILQNRPDKAGKLPSDEGNFPAFFGRENRKNIKIQIDKHGGVFYTKKGDIVRLGEGE